MGSRDRPSRKPRRSPRTRAQPKLQPLMDPPQNVELIRKPRKPKPEREETSDEG